ncbi:MAG: AAA domain-containing protein, partial [bacterium]
ISRGVASVIVGDSKQMPPTSFFDRKDSGDAEEVNALTTPAGGSEAARDASLADALEPLESVLEEAIASGIPQRSLLWHYRSRDERLIEFSNRRSYGAKLQTFPAARRAHPNLGVEFRFVGGTYDRAGTATNRKEAEAVVAEIRRRLLTDDGASANRSIGVVTFSVAQQSLVQDLLDEALDADAKLCERMAAAAEAGEEVFVKNLENVQGDERATMLFSICYGRDASGALHHNFGPLNLAGGERRLNVAVSRAREKVIVFSSVRASELDPRKCTSKGAQDLRDYLAFAELGTVPAAREECDATEPIDVSAIERRLARALEARGFRVDLHVGRSRDYRVSLALALPEAPDEWILGIELDGAFHRTAPTVVDRELVRTGVLTALGWRTVQVSVIDVLRDETKTIERIIAAARA